MTVVSLRGVGFSYGDRRVLDGVDLDVVAREIVAVTGPSGSGKTTLLSIVAGFERADSGTVDVVGGDRPSWRDVAMLPQSLGLLPELSVAENVALPLELGAREPWLGVDALLDRLGLARLARRLPDEISRGEQQRTALARALVAAPAVLVADEPVSHQDRAWAEVCTALLAEVAAAGTACLLATHDDVAVAVATRRIELR